jgi:hypothetical protein
VIAERSAPCGCQAVALAERVFPRTRDVDAEAPRVRRVRLVAADDAVRSSLAAS